MLDTLTDMEVANTIMRSTTAGTKTHDAESVNMLDKRFSELNLTEMTPLDHKSAEYKALADYLLKSSGTAHGIRYRLEDIFRVEREGEKERFEKSGFSKLKKHDRRLLWHGSRATNYGGILSQGLRIAPPEAPVSGYAFGKVTYSPPSSFSFPFPFSFVDPFPHPFIFLPSPAAFLSIYFCYPPSPTPNAFFPHPESPIQHPPTLS